MLGTRFYPSKVGGLSPFGDSPVRPTATGPLYCRKAAGLYAIFSNVSVLPLCERKFLLTSLAEIAATEFTGQVDRNMTTALYIGIKPNGLGPR